MNNDHFKASRISVLALATLLFTSAPVQAEPRGPSAIVQGSLGAAAGSVVIVAGSPALLVGVPDFTIMGVERLAQGLKLTLKGSGQTAALVLMVPLAAAASTAVVVGGVVTVVAVGSGWVLSCAGQTLGYVADGSGSLLFSEPCCPRCC